MLELLVCLIKENLPESFFAEKTEKPFRAGVACAVKDYIDNNCRAPITLDSLEKQFHYSKFAISKSFTAHMGVPVMKYYAALRVQAAKKMLESGLSVTETANELHCSSVCMFSRFFKNKTGLSPTQYIKK